jgi:hypothetical protein
MAKQNAKARVYRESAFAQRPNAYFVALYTGQDLIRAGHRTAIREIDAESTPSKSGRGKISTLAYPLEFAQRDAGCAPSTVIWVYRTQQIGP